MEWNRVFARLTDSEAASHYKGILPSNDISAKYQIALETRAAGAANLALQTRAEVVAREECDDDQRERAREKEIERGGRERGRERPSPSVEQPGFDFEVAEDSFTPPQADIIMIIIIIACGCGATKRPPTYRRITNSINRFFVEQVCLPTERRRRCE